MQTRQTGFFHKYKLPAVAKNLVIIPTYNERENIRKMVKIVFSLPVPFELLIVDDGSPDGTADIVRNLQEEYPDKLHLIVRLKKSGLGTAYIRGFEWGLEQGYQYLFEMDCDFSHDPGDLLRLHRTLSENRADVSVGSRYMPGGKLANWPAGRVFISKGASN
jgi:dolichol-phosphate mannosyltransferase